MKLIEDSCPRQRSHPNEPPAGGGSDRRPMVFSDPLFLFAFLSLALLSILVSIGRGRYLVIRLFSLAFYYWSSGLFTLVLVGSLLVNRTVRLRLQRSRGRPIFALGLIANLAALGFFEYPSFVSQNVDAALGTSTAIRFVDVAVPIGGSASAGRGA